MAQGKLHIQLGALSTEHPSQKFRALPPIKNERPVYMITGKGFFNKKDILIGSGQIIYWDDEPNKDMTPMNKLAFVKYNEFLDKLDAEGMKNAKKTGKSYNPEVRLEWSDDANSVIDDLPLPDKVMGADKSALADDIIR